MRRLVLIAAIYAALTASFVGRAARPADIAESPAPGGAAAAARDGGTSHRLPFGRVLWVPAGQPMPGPARSAGMRHWAPAPATVVADAGPALEAAN
jgi:hypothetical protein